MPTVSEALAKPASADLPPEPMAVVVLQDEAFPRHGETITLRAGLVTRIVKLPVVHTFNPGPNRTLVLARDYKIGDVVQAFTRRG